MVVYRVTKQKYASDISGEGARLGGGRWNGAGNRMLYTSLSRPMALLEILAHSTVLPLGMAMVTLKLHPRSRMRKIDIDDLPTGWNDRPHSLVSQNIGDEFLRRGDFLALEVPSVILTRESNILINPLHLSASLIQIVNVEPLDIDSRLK